MNRETSKAKRILHVKVRVPPAEMASIAAVTMKMMLPIYKTFGDAKVRLLRNVDDPSVFLQVIEYESVSTLELSRQRFASDPAVLAWRSLFSGSIEIDVYEDQATSI
ncbi:MAG TPA: hypothetical protein VEJ40_00190 [Pseudolabrys sp.]|nr:hypothetical protein [Pseudolabrys sp.]